MDNVPWSVTALSFIKYLLAHLGTAFVGYQTHVVTCLDEAIGAQEANQSHRHFVKKQF